ncbi:MULTISPECIES: acyl-CoA thioesterase [Marinobacter]|uniref:Thioesterase family protein n=1 Tax=Marinobacter suaedae TaxID=3057675 RepID=A0ABT8W011_9GAMM|nr:MULTISPECIES: thioesterase family protein [unclassified Marinobacter]MBZ2169770.1 acyl-CoA thioesterase [Marinobacter sp. F4216]MDO3721593.1 thioesterase family protein [Marinobacter sp. chi1]
MSSEQPFRFRFRVRYGECDAQGVVFNARYADYVDIAINEYIRTLFGDYQRLLDQDLDIQVVSLTVNWKAPAQFDDVLEARIRAGRIGNTSFTLHLEFYRYGDDKFIADADITDVMIRSSKMEKTPIPDNIRARLEAGAPGVLISHAGEHIVASGQAS